MSWVLKDGLSSAPGQGGVAKALTTRVARQIAPVILEGQEPRRRLSQVVPDDQVTDAPDDDPESDGHRGRVEPLHEVEPGAPEDEIAGDDRADDAADQADPSAVDRQDVADRLELR